ncbi:Ti-type conjugative transfer relaxase TraA [Brucella sp. NBRC 12950]|uniref:Ti-type conjugative transfer relaxase TraA n=1 Tax=Brucella sp. NBRC 12950 TaxID=2994518 RepID=UPI0025561BDD|nr:Ti-type conjugative transfer relaxase TraA [Brucella sp. NBRC 12950]
MAIYHLRVQEISAARGQSAVAAIAYRRGATILNEATGEWKDFSKKSHVAHTEFAIPQNAPRWIEELLLLSGDQPSQKFWSQVEHLNVRANSRYANEIEMALPLELSVKQNIDLVRAFVAERLTSRGLVADWAYHDVPNNPHVHIMVQTRPLTETGFGKVLQPIFDEGGEVRRGEGGKIDYARFGIGKPELKDMRVAWADIQNQHLALHGFDVLVDHRSYEEQGLALIPTEHVGVAANVIHASGGTSDRVERNKQIAALNAQSVLENPELILQKLTTQHSVFTDKDVAREVFRYTDSREAFQRVKLRIGASENLIAICAPVYDPVTDKEVRPAIYTTRAVFENEHSIIESVGKLDESDTFYVSENRVSKARTVCERQAGLALSDEQTAVIRYATDRAGISVIVGYAGAGKSTVMNVVRQAYEANGSRVFGAALAGVAVDGLKQSSGISSRTIRSWEVNWARGKRLLQSGDVFVLDEAGMVSTDQMRMIIEHVQKADAKLILLGDHRQLQPIMSGAAFRGIADYVGYRELTGIIRQHNDHHRNASLMLANGKAEDALYVYNALGNIVYSRDEAQAKTSLIKEWCESWRAGNDALILSHRNVDVDALNVLARMELKSEGALQNGFDVTTSKGHRSFSIGEKIICLEGDFETGLRNGSTGFIADYQSKTGVLTIETDSGSIVEFSTQRYNAIDYGYAQTIHKSQGKTVGQTFVYASKTMDAQLTYVALTRHRDDLRIYVNLEEFGDRAGFSKALSRDRQKDVTFLHRNTQDYGDALRSFMERRDIGTDQDWRYALQNIVSHWKRRLETVVSRLQSVGHKLLPKQQSQRVQQPTQVPGIVNDHPLTSPSNSRRHLPPVVSGRRYPEMSDRVRQVAARLQQSLDHAERVDSKSARTSAALSCRNAINDGHGAADVRQYLEQLREVLPPATVVAAGAEFDPAKLALALSQFSEVDWARIEQDWPKLHYLSRASIFVSQVEIASVVLTDRKEDRILADYERDWDQWHVPDKPLIPALTVFNQSVPETVSRLVLADPDAKRFERTVRQDFAKCFVDHGNVADLFISHVQQGGTIGKHLADMEIRPQDFGELLGKTSIFGRPNEARQAALAGLRFVSSSLDDYARCYTTLTANLTRQEEAFRDKMQTPIADLSARTKRFISKLHDHQTDMAKLLNSDDCRKARMEISGLLTEINERFGAFKASPTESERFNRMVATLDPVVAEHVTTLLQQVQASDSRANWQLRAMSLHQNITQSLDGGHDL